MSLDIFYKVLLTVFKALVDNDKTVATININPSSRNIILNIHHKYYLEFKFELRLDLNTDNSLGAKDLCIKKLEQNIDTLRKEHNTLQKFIDEFMELTITDNSLGAKDLCIKKLEQNIDTLRKEHNTLQKFIDEFMELTITDFFVSGVGYSFNESYSIKINTPVILLRLIGAINQAYITLNGDTWNIPIINTSAMQFNSNFKMIKCHTLTLQSMASVQFNYKNLPLSLKKLIISGDTTVAYFTQMDLPNLEIIQLENSKITTIHSSISHLKSVKTIRITGCTGFQERDLLLTS